MTDAEITKAEKALRVLETLMMRKRRRHLRSPETKTAAQSFDGAVAVLPKLEMPTRKFATRPGFEITFERSSLSF
ncbi:MAG: hypothetical protein QOH39_26 [Verrucomicrobiota bacterium]|jgi:hypothetical protein